MNTHDFGLMTVPHTGTIFTDQLLKIAGARGKYCEQHWRIDNTPLPGLPLLITARDPYLATIRLIYEGESFKRAALMWNECINTLPFVDHFIFDIGCREEDRIAHVNDALAFCGVGGADVEDFVSAWKPANTSEEYAGGLESAEHYKADYLKTGTLPGGYDWAELDVAIEWYKSLPTNDYV